LKKFTYIVILILFFSCEEETKNYKPLSSGRINSVSVITDKATWESKVGNEIRNIFASEFKGLPQIEESFNLSYIPYEAFTGFGRTGRNIIFINQKKDDKPKMARDKFARPQLFLEISGTNETQLIENLKKAARFSINEFQKGEIEENKRRILKSPLNKTNLKDSLSISLTMPSAYSIFKEENKTIWFQKPLKNGTSNLIASELNIQYESFDEIDLLKTIKTRDSLNKEFVPGRVDGSYMITEEAYLPYFDLDEANGFASKETRGTWEVKGDFMGGPFINYVIKDTINKRILYLEGFIFSPSQRKRDGIIELEAIIKSLKVFKKN
tara:strand:+ start:36 stop:1010 length:975 start_codon:yes stop_codon:yes gene_type:complete